MPGYANFDDTTTIISEDINVTIHTKWNGFNYLKTYIYSGDNMDNEFI